MWRRVFVVFLVLVTLTSVYSITRAGAPHVQAASPTTLNFQARLLNSSGSLVPDGIYNVEFKLYNASTSSGSTQGSCTGDANCLWTETRLASDPADQQIVVKNGYLSAYLGDKTALPADIWDQQLWLTMNIGGVGIATWDGEMTPRIRLTSVPFAFRATVADSAETLQKNTGSFTGTVEFATMTADRKFLFPDTSLATTASPGTICVYNGAASNCPASSGSAYYIQNDTVLQTQTNFHIQARDSTTNGTIGGVISGAANGQTVDLLQFRASDDSTVLASVTAAGNLKVASSVDVYSAGTLSVGTSTATAITVGKAGITTTIAGALTVNEAATFNDNVTLAAGKTLRITGDNTAGRPASPAEGTLYFDTTTKQLLVYANGKWQGDRSTATMIVAASNSSQATKDAADYIATGTNDENTINTALTAAAGGSVYLAEGTFTVAATILVPNNTTLTGAGNGSIVQFANLGGVSDNMIENKDNPGAGVVISSLKLDGRRDINTSGSTKAIYLINVGTGGASYREGARLNDLTVNRFRSFTVELNSSSYSTIANSTFLDNKGGYAIYLGSTSTFNTVTGNTINSTATGTSDGVVVSGSNNTVVSNTITVVTRAVWVVGSNNVISSNNLSSTGASNTYGTIFVNSGATLNTVSSNNIEYTSSDGIHVAGSDSNSFIGNMLKKNGGTGYSINISNSTSDTNYLANNILGTGTINDVGTGTIYVNQPDGSGNLINKSQGGGFAVGTSSATASFTLQGSFVSITLPTPTAPTLTTTGTAGSTTYGYKITALDGTGETLASTETTIATGNATLTSTNKINITWVPVGGAIQYKIYRTTAGGTPNTTGLISTVAGNVTTVSDTGLAASGSTPVANTTGNATIAGTIQGGFLGITNGATIGTTLQVTGASTLIGGATIRGVTVDNATATDDRILIAVTSNASAARFDGTITSADLTAAHTWTLPNESGTFCMQGSTNCGFATTSSLSGYIQLAPGSVQTDNSANASIYINDTAGGNLLHLQAGGDDKFVVDNSGNTTIAGDVTVAAGQTIQLVGDITANRPVSPGEGTLYFDTTTKQLLIYANGKWQADRSESIIVAADDSTPAQKDTADFVADGTADQSTINDALTAASGGKVYLMPGIYHANGTVLIPNNTTLTGAGSSSIIALEAGSTSDNLIENSDTTAGTGVTVRDLVLDNSTGTGGTQNAVYLSGLQGADTSNITSIRITGAAFDNNVVIDNSKLSYFNDNYLEGNITLDNSSFILNFSNNLLAAGVSLDNSSLITSFVGNVVGADISANNSAYIETMTGNQVYGAVSFNTGYFLTMSGNTLNNLTLTGVDKSNITGNSFSYTGSTAAITLITSDSNTITSNSISDKGGTGYAIDIDVDSNLNYLASNTIDTYAINDNASDTIYAGQIKDSANDNYLIQPAGTIELMKDTNITGNLVATGDGTFNGGDLTVATTTVTDDKIALSVTTGGTDSFTGTITNSDLTAVRTWTFPDASGVICIVGSTSCSTAGSGYVQFAPGSVQTDNSANASIYINDTAGGNLLQLQSGGSDKFVVDNSGNTAISGNVTVAASKSLTLNGGNTASRPASPTEGMLYYDTTTKQLLIYANGKWQADRTDAVIVAASNSSQADKDAADYVADGNTGAAADGDQVQINSALTAGAGKKVVLLAGTYTVDASINVPSNTTMTGVGTGTLITLPNSWSTNLTIIKNSNYGLVAGNNDITISHLKIDGNLSNVSGGSQSAIQLSADYSGTTNMRNVHINNVVIQNFNGAGIYNEANNSRITNNVIDTVAYGIDVEAGSNSTVTGNVVRSTTEIGILVYSSAGNTITGNALGNITKTGIDIEGTGTANNVISGNSISGNSSVQSGIFVGDTANHNVLSDNTITSFTSGISTQSVSYNTISGNTISESGGATLNEAIYLETSDSNTITGNIITDSSASSSNYAIDISNASSDNNYVADNTLGGGTINDASGGDTIYGGQATGTTFAIQPSSSITITANAASTIQTTAGNLTADAAATLNLGITNATAVSISRTGQTTTVNGALTVAQVTRLNGNVGINIGSATPTADLQFGESSSRTINVQGRTTNAAGNSLTIAAGAAGAGASAFSGGTLTLQGGAAGGTGNANGGSVTIAGGAGVGTGTQGLVNLSTTAFTSSPVQTYTVAGVNNIAAGLVDQYSTIPVLTTTSTGIIVSVPDPAQNTVIGRVLYISARDNALDFTLRLNAAGTPIDIAMKENSTATLIWNGDEWTAAGASSSTDLQSAYNNTLTSAGGAEILLNPVGGAADGFTIRNNGTTPIVGGLLEVQSSIGTNLFSVYNRGIELANNGGAEETFSTDWTAAPVSATIVQTSTSGEYVTGRYGVRVTTTTTANSGVRNNLTSNPAVSTNYTVSFTAKSNAASTPIDVQYSYNGGTNLIACTNYSTQTITNANWTKITCTIPTNASAVTNPDLIIRKTNGTSPTIYIDNLSFQRNDGTTQPSNVQIGGGNDGGPITLFTLDRASAPPVEAGDETYYGSMYYDTITGSIQCYEADGWGACGSPPDNIITLTPEYTGAVLNGTGIGVMTADFCGNGGGLSVNTGFCASGEARNYYRWTSPQATLQEYSIFVTYKLPNTFKQFAGSDTMKLTAFRDDADNADALVKMATYRKTSSGGLALCGTETNITQSSGGWEQRDVAGDENTCSFTGGDYIIFKITMSSRNNTNVYVENLDFTFINK